MVYFPEYQYTCIGYSSGNTDGRGSGIEFNDKIFQSAKEIVEFAQGDPEIFLLLPLLEEGIAGDRISDMVQNIIDDDICNYTIDIMAQRLIEADDGFNKSLSTIFALASKAHDLFKSSELEEKRRIITILFPNLEMSAEKLVFKPRKPFDVFLNLPPCPNWLPGTGSNRRPND